MNFSYFDELPGVGEVNIYLRCRLDAKSQLLNYSNPFTWIEDLAYLQLEHRKPISSKSLFKELENDNLKIVEEIPFIEIKDKKLFFNSEKHLIAAIMIPVYSALVNKTNLNKLNCLMPYDYIQYFRPTIEPADYEHIIYAIENSANKHYIRFLLLLLRRCKSVAHEWSTWIKDYIVKQGEEIDSYADYTVKRDARVTYTSAMGQDDIIYSFVDRLFVDKKLAEYERRHFIESCDNPVRAGEILYHKLVQTNYRFDITPINIFGIHLFADKKIIDLISKIAEHPISSPNNKHYAKLALERLKK